VAEDRDIVLLQGLRNTLMAASVIGSSTLFALMGWVAVAASRGSAGWVGLPALLALVFALLAIVTCARGSAMTDRSAIERSWSLANRFTAVAAVALLLFPALVLSQLSP
jgi:cytochrome bd-type quinol oxidase subunit 2